MHVVELYFFLHLIYFVHAFYGLYRLVTVLPIKLHLILCCGGLAECLIMSRWNSSCVFATYSHNEHSNDSGVCSLQLCVETSLIYFARIAYDRLYRVLLCCVLCCKCTSAVWAFVCSYHTSDQVTCFVLKTHVAQ